jgi:hypothetical protein
MWRDFDRARDYAGRKSASFASDSIAHGLDLLKFSQFLFQNSPEVCNVSGSCLEHHCRKEAAGFREKLMQG